MATDPITALIEVAGVFVNPHGPTTTFRTPPWAVFAVEGVVKRVLDLTDAHIVAELDTSVAELSGDWRFSQQRYLDGEGPIPPTQLLGKAAYESDRAQGIRYFSAKNLGHGLGFAIFPDRLTSVEASYLEVFDPHGFIKQRLP
jgi:hypothetical protein